MTLRTRTAATVLLCLFAAGCGNGGKIEISPPGDYETGSPVSDSPVSPPQPATAGTLVVLDYEYSYTPIGATPAPFQEYRPGETTVHIAGSRAPQKSTTLTPADPGTLILMEYEYSYTPLGSAPSGFQKYNGDAPLLIAVGTSIIVVLNSGSWHDPTSSDPRLLAQQGARSQSADGERTTAFGAMKAGSVDVLAQAPKCKGEAPCYGPFRIHLAIS